MSADLEQALSSLSEDELYQILADLEMQLDFPKYAETFLKVQTTRGTLIPFKLNGPQRLMYRIIEEHIRPKRLVRLVILKGRRMGISTFMSGYYYGKTSRSPNRYAVQITHEPEATDTLFKMVKRFYNHLEADDKPETQYNNTRLLEFNNKDGTGLNSAFRVATAGKEDFGSGQLVHYFHGSEVAKWDTGNATPLLTSVLQCVPNIDDTVVAFESTAKGIGGEFHSRFWGARYRIWIKRLDENGDPVIEESVNEKAPEDNEYTSIFFPWFVFEENRMTPPKDFKLDPKEEAIKKKFGLDDEQMYWRRWTISNKNNGNEALFDQENPASPELAFLTSGTPVFDNVKLHAMKETAPKPIARYECLVGIGQWVTSDVGRLRVWEEPKPGRHYIVSADVAEGLAHGDFSSADVIDHISGKQVAHWHGKCEPHEYVEILFALGKRYNNAWMAPERNNHGLYVVQCLFEKSYPKMYMEEVPEPPGKPRKRYGWVTSHTTRPMIIDNLIREVMEGSHGINCAETFEEMMMFKRQINGRQEADDGQNDDRVMSLAIGKYLRQVLPLPASDPRPHDKKVKGRANTRKNPGAKAWT